MATYDLEEQEQLDELKTWWKMYGNWVAGAIGVLAIAVVGVQGWSWWQRQQASEASVLYGGLQQAVTQQDAKRARDLAGELIDKYGRTAYAAMGALLAAKINVDQGESKTARAQLQWAAEKGGDETLRALARLRLAALLIDEQAYDEALKALAHDLPMPFQARQAELKADALAASGKKAEARAAYDTALERLAAAKKDGTDGRMDDGRHQAYRELIRVKRDALGVTA